jgi:hypothetical protein
MTLSNLRARLETATEPDQAEVLEMAFDVLIHFPERTIGEPLDWICDMRQNFKRMTEAKAYTDAALLIMKEVLPECYPVLDFIDNVCVFWKPPLAVKAFVPIPHLAARPQSASCISLAIIAAICAAKGDGDVAD